MNVPPLPPKVGRRARREDRVIKGNQYLIVLGEEEEGAHVHEQREEEVDEHELHQDAVEDRAGNQESWSSILGGEPVRRRLAAKGL